MPIRRVSLYGIEEWRCDEAALGRESSGLGSAPVSSVRREAARVGLGRGGGGVAKVSGRKKMGIEETWWWVGLVAANK
jgi:hypothetical protein